MEPLEAPIHPCLRRRRQLIPLPNPSHDALASNRCASPPLDPEHSLADCSKLAPACGRGLFGFHVPITLQVSSYSTMLCCANPWVHTELQPGNRWGGRLLALRERLGDRLVRRQRPSLRPRRRQLVRVEPSAQCRQVSLIQLAPRGHSDGRSSSLAQRFARKTLPLPTPVLAPRGASRVSGGWNPERPPAWRWPHHPAWAPLREARRARLRRDPLLPSET